MKPKKIISTKELVTVALIFITIIWVLRFSTNNPISHLYRSPWWEFGVFAALFASYLLIRLAIRKIMTPKEKRDV